MRKYLPLILSLTNSKRRAMFDKCNLNLRHLTSFALSVFNAQFIFCYFFLLFSANLYLGHQIQQPILKLGISNVITNQIVYDEKLITKTQTILEILFSLKGSKFVKIEIKSLEIGCWIWWTRQLFWITELSQDVFLKAICLNVHGSEWIEGKKF